MAKHRDANTGIDLKGREKFVRDNALVLVTELERRCETYRKIVTRHEKRIVESKRQGKVLKMPPKKSRHQQIRELCDLLITEKE